MGHCCHVSAGPPSCYLDMLENLEKRECMVFGPSFAASLAPLAHRQNAIFAKVTTLVSDV